MRARIRAAAVESAHDALLGGIVSGLALVALAFLVH